MTRAAADPVALDAGELLARVARPERPALVAALACVTGALPERVRRLVEARASEPFDALWLALATDAGIDDEAVAWEALAARGLVPAGWVGDRARTFAQLVDFALRDGLASPPFELAVALAADAGTVVRVEALAREAAARLAPWTDARVARLEWCVADDLPVWADEANWGPRWRSVESALEVADSHRPTTPRPASMPSLPLWAAAVAPSRFVECHTPVPDTREAVARLNAARLAAAGRWSARALADLRDHVVWSALGAPTGVRAARSLREVPDPFGPRLEIWRAGYAFAFLDEQTMLLVAPRV